ncbi:branched-chain amino acid ABC transporter substrate-binding protein, partial [Mesorhizobium sp. M00.F.Ca.ET.151.01.1.1]
MSKHRTSHHTGHPTLHSMLKPLVLCVGALLAVASAGSFADDLPVKIGFAAP